MKNRYTRLLTAALLLTALGCGDRMVTIHGTVTVDEEPLPRGRIEFESSGEKGPIAAAEIRDGQYEVSILPGNKRIRITGGKVIGQRPFTQHPQSPMIEEIQPLVPARYNDQTTLQREVTGSETTYDFQLESTP